MGGPAYYKFPKHVWTPVGGWWLNQPNWRGNTLAALAGLGTVSLGLFLVSGANEWRPNPGHREGWTQQWARTKPGYNPDGEAEKALSPLQQMENAVPAVKKAWEARQ